MELIHLQGQQEWLSPRELEDIVRHGADVLGFRLVRYPVGTKRTTTLLHSVTSSQAMTLLTKLRVSRPAKFAGAELALAYRLEYYGLLKRTSAGGKTFAITEAGVKFKSMWKDVDAFVKDFSKN